MNETTPCTAPPPGFAPPPPPPPPPGASPVASQGPAAWPDHNLRAVPAIWWHVNCRLGPCESAPSLIGPPHCGSNRAHRQLQLRIEVDAGLRRTGTDARTIALRRGAAARRFRPIHLHRHSGTTRAEVGVDKRPRGSSRDRAHRKAIGELAAGATRPEHADAYLRNSVRGARGKRLACHRRNETATEIGHSDVTFFIPPDSGARPFPESATAPRSPPAPPHRIRAPR